MRPRLCVRPYQRHSSSSSQVQRSFQTRYDYYYSPRSTSFQSRSSSSSSRRQVRLVNNSGRPSSSFRSSSLDSDSFNFRIFFLHPPSRTQLLPFVLFLPPSHSRHSPSRLPVPNLPSSPPGQPWPPKRSLHHLPSLFLHRSHLSTSRLLLRRRNSVSSTLRRRRPRHVNVRVQLDDDFERVDSSSEEDDECRDGEGVVLAS